MAESAYSPAIRRIDRTMDQLPGTWAALCALAFVLGVRHGFDADHLATIDGLTRYNARDESAARATSPARCSRSVTASSWCCVALVAGSLAAGWQTPAWLETTGVAVSVVFLFGLAFLNVRAVLVAASARGRRAGRAPGAAARTLPRRSGAPGRSPPWACCSRCRSTRCRRRRCSRSPRGGSAGFRDALFVAGAVRARHAHGRRRQRRSGSTG